MNVDGLSFITPPCPHPECEDGTITRNVKMVGATDSEVVESMCPACGGSGLGGKPRLEWRCSTCNGTNTVPNRSPLKPWDDGRDDPMRVPCPDPNHRMHGHTLRLLDVEAVEHMGLKHLDKSHEPVYRIVAEWNPPEGTP